MMGSTISSLNDIPLYVTFDEDRVVNLVREVARASGGISDAQGNPVLSRSLLEPLDWNVRLVPPLGPDALPLDGHRFDNFYLNRNFEARRKIFQMLGDAAETLNPTSNQCLDLEIEEMEFIPPATSTGQANLKLKVRLLDARGRVVEDASGKRPPVQITFPSITNGELDPAEGETDEKGEFTTQATILNLDRPIQGERVYMQVDARAEYQIKDAQGRPIGDPLVATDSKQLNYTGGSGSGSSGSGGSGGSGGGYCPPGANCDPDPSQADPDAGKADGVGDPHLYTLDRLRYDFHGVGEYILSQSVVPELDFQLQARFRPFGSSTVASMTRAIATQMGSHRVAIYTTPAPELRIDGQLTDLPPGGYLLLALAERPPQDPEDEDSAWETPDPNCTPGGCYGYELFRGHQGEYILNWPEGETLTVQPYFPNSAAFAHLSFTLELPTQYLGRVRGLLGNYDYNPSNDLQSRSGQLVSETDFNGLYPVFGDSWRVSPAESLFDYGPGESSESLSNRSFPSGFAEISPSQRIGAERICRDSGIQLHPRFSLEDCIFDVAIMGGEAVAGYGGTYRTTEADGYTFTPLASVGRVRDLVKSGSDYWVLEEVCNQFSFNTCVDRRERVSRITPFGGVIPVLEAEKNEWPGYSEWFRRIGAFEDGVMLLKGTRSFDAGVGTRNVGVLNKVNAQGQVSTFVDDLPFGAFGRGTAEYLSNLVQVGNSVVFTRYSFPVIMARQSRDWLRSCCGQELLQVDATGQTTQVMDLSAFFPPGFSLISDNSATKLVGQEYYFLANNQGNPSILKANPSQGLAVVVDGRVIREQNGGDSVPIRDIDPQGANLVALLGQSRLLEDAEGSWRSGLARVSPQGSLSPIFRIPQDFSLQPEKIVVEDAGFGLVACPRLSSNQPEFYSCALYRVTPSGG